MCKEQLDGKRIRLIISKNEEELLCRKTSFKEINEFLQSDKKTLLKGRLQFDRTGHEISVIIKGLNAGTISIEQFRHWQIEASFKL